MPEMRPAMGKDTALKAPASSTPGTARESEPTRFSHITGQETQRQTHTDRVQQPGSPVSIGGASKSHGTAGMPPPAAPGQTISSETRYSRNPGGTSVPPPRTSDAVQSGPAGQEPRQVSAAAVPPVGGTSPVIHPGMAGSPPHLTVERSSIRETRYSRNPSTVLPAPIQGAPQRSPVRQEPAQDGKPAASSVSGQRPVARPGTAGTAPERSRASLPPQTATPGPMRAKPSVSAKQTPPIKASGGKKPETRKTAPKPPRPNGGPKHGRP